MLDSLFEMLSGIQSQIPNKFSVKTELNVQLSQVFMENNIGVIIPVPHIFHLFEYLARGPL